MKKYLLLWPFLFIGCAPGIKRIGYNYGDAPNIHDCDPQIAIQSEIEESKECEKLGSIKVYDKMSVGCGEDDIMEILKSEACDLGANLTIIRKEKRPDFLSTCYRMEGDFYKCQDSAIHLNNPKRYEPGEVAIREKKDVTNQIIIGVVVAVVSFIVSFVVLNS